MTRSFDDCLPCDMQNPARIARPPKIGGAAIHTILEGGDRPSAIFAGGFPLLNAEDGAIGSHPSKANFLSQLQRSLEDGGMAPAGLLGFARGQIPDWYRTELLPTADAPAGFPEDRAAAWDDYLDGVNTGTLRGGTLGLLVGAGVMLAGLYLGGVTTFSPKPAKPAAKPAGALSTSTSKHRARARKGR